MTTLIEAVSSAILRRVPDGYGMTAAEAREYARAAIGAVRNYYKPTGLTKPGDAFPGNSSDIVLNQWPLKEWRAWWFTDDSIGDDK